MRPMSLSALIQTVHEQVPDMHRLTQRWVEVNSFSTHLAGVNAMADALQSAFSLAELSARREPGGPGSGDHLFWSTAAAKQTPPVLLIGHHDTVFPPGSFEGWQQAAGRARGPGCFDMKGGLSLIWGVLSTFARHGLLARLPVVVASVADEEVGSRDSRPHLEALARGAACALVFESGRSQDQIVTRRRGTGVMQAVASGKAAHAGNAYREGANAIWALARFIDFAQAESVPERGLTVNVGTVSGGTSANTVPARAEALLDLRFDTLADAQALIERLRAGAAALSVPGTSILLEGGINRRPLERSPAAEELYRAYAQAQRAAGLGDGEHPLVGGGSDANTVSGVGLPAIDGLGPRGGGFHTLDEYVELDSFGPKAEALLRFLYERLR
ncbi:MAG: hypothetical protein RL033_7036 [Pseudomonadota bacterium]